MTIETKRGTIILTEIKGQWFWEAIPTEGMTQYGTREYNAAWATTRAYIALCPRSPNFGAV